MSWRLYCLLIRALVVCGSVLFVGTELYAVAAPMLEGSKGSSSIDVTRIKLMLAYIHTEYPRDVTVSDIARSANVGERECFRCFKQILGTTPSLYMARHRINAASRMLLETDGSVTDIALSCGFSSPSYFCKVFHKMMGLSPREFRKDAMRNQKGRRPGERTAAT